MAVLEPIEIIKTFSFEDFCLKFNIISDKIVGKDDFDENLIKEELDKRENEIWFVSFIEDKNDGYFLLYKL